MLKALKSSLQPPSLPIQSAPTHQESDKVDTTSTVTIIGNEALPTPKYLYTFPEDSKFKSKGVIIDVSGISINLADIFRGGIGYGGGASRLMASAMADIGHEGNLYNLPFCLEGALHLPQEFCKLEMISTKNAIVALEEVKAHIQEAIKEGFIQFNLPLDLSGHASLMSVSILNGAATLKFYDSLGDTAGFYEKRYNDQRLLDFIKSLLPDSVELASEKPQVLHLLDQGDENSSGCGYYTLYTALLLKEREELRTFAQDQVELQYDQRHDLAIRAELIVRTLLPRGLDNVDISSTALCTEKREHIFNRIGFGVRKLIANLKLRVAQEKDKDDKDFAKS